jgi:hypothetical protein
VATPPRKDGQPSGSEAAGRGGDAEPALASGASGPGGAGPNPSEAVGRGEAAGEPTRTSQEETDDAPDHDAPGEPYDGELLVLEPADAQGVAELPSVESSDEMTSEETDVRRPEPGAEKSEVESLGGSDAAGEGGGWAEGRSRSKRPAKTARPAASQPSTTSANGPTTHATEQALLPARQNPARERRPPARLTQQRAAYSTASMPSLPFPSPPPPPPEADPRTYAEAMRSPQAECWREAMEKEMRSLEEARTFELAERPPGAKVVGSKWVYKVKRNLDGSVDKYKARLVAQGFTQQP